MGVPTPKFSSAEHGFTRSTGRLRGRASVATSLLTALSLLLSLGGIQAVHAGGDRSETPLPIPILKSTATPEEIRAAQCDDTCHIPRAEPLPAVDSPPTPVGLQPFVPSAKSAPRSTMHLASVKQVPDAPYEIPPPTVRPQQATIPGGLRPLSEITTDIAPSRGPLPDDRSDVLVVSTIDPMCFSRTNNLIRYEWEAPVVCHRPLYFQDVPLEHFGQSCAPCVQPAISAAKFLGNVIILPYHLTLDPPSRPTYNLHTYPRPGTPVPCLRQTIPLELTPLLVEAGVVAAIVLVIP